jgi:UDP-N-acetylmuramate: L-alanyl-gamma-D-glutamyl-meso-diaminopimelate ligase
MKIHILAIVGKMTTPLAVELKRLGHEVTGSDQDKIYPPSSTVLESHHIPVNQQPIDPSIDLVIVGSSYGRFQRCIDELAMAKKLDIPTISATRYISQLIVRPNSIVVAGSYGKTTITAALTHIFTSLDYNPSYCFAEEAVSSIPSMLSTASDWSIIEGDESINGLDTEAKFFYYNPKYLILTSTLWEHKDSYPTSEANLQAYQKLVDQIPKDGHIVYNPNDPNIKKLLTNCQATVTPYQNFDFETKLLGSHNHQNMNAALTLIKSLGLDVSLATKSISNFYGVKRRLQILSTTNNITIIDDFAQSPQRVSAAVNAVREKFPNNPIKVFYEPHASFLQQPGGISGLGNAFSEVSEVVLSKISFQSSQKDNRVTAKDYQQEIGNQLKYIPIFTDIQKHYQETLRSGEILVHFSSGGLDGLTILQGLISHISSQMSYT